MSGSGLASLGAGAWCYELAYKVFIAGVLCLYKKRR